jgi:hypothetical protein
MEWLVPVLFVLASLAQWWMQRNRQGQEEETLEASPQEKTRSAPDRRESPPQEEFGDLGDLLEALGRRRHESPPPPVENSEPPVLPSPPEPRVSPHAREPTPAPIPEPVIILETPKPAPVPVFTAFPEAKIAPISEPSFISPSEETPRVTFRPFPAAKKADSTFSHRWAEKLRSPESVRDAIVLSEILAPPVSLR